MFGRLAQIVVLIVAWVLSGRVLVYAQHGMADQHARIQSHASKSKLLTGGFQLPPKPKANTLGLNWDLSHPLSHTAEPIQWGPPSTFWPMRPLMKELPTERGKRTVTAVSTVS